MSFYPSKLILILVALMLVITGRTNVFSEETDQGLPSIVRTGNTLMFTGSLLGTAAEAAACKPFSIRYRVNSTGDIPPSSGIVRIDFVASSGLPVYTKQYPLSEGEGIVPVDTANLSQGVYLLRLSISASSQEHGLYREQTLAEQTLTVSGPIEITRTKTSLPRVLVWMGRTGRVVEQAMTETIVKQAFEQQELYYKIVDSAEDFAAHAQTGLFNAYMLLDPQEAPIQSDWLKAKLRLGHGLAIIGSGEPARSLGQNFGFSLEEVLPKQSKATLAFNGTSGFSLSGTILVSDSAYSPAKKEARSAAIYSSSGKDAALIDFSGKGKIFVMPISFSSSAYQAGTPDLFSLVLRAISVFITPESDEPGGTITEELSISSSHGRINAKIREILPLGSRILWSNAGVVIENDALSFTLTADKQPSKLLYAYQPSIAGTALTNTEIYPNCSSYLTHGTME